MQQYTVITLFEYDLYLTHQQAETPEQALLDHSVSMGHIALTPFTTPQNTGETLTNICEVDYIVCKGTTSIASFTYDNIVTECIRS